MGIKQFNGTYHPREDRLQVRLNTPNDEEFKLWLTRRLTLHLVHFCEQFALKRLSTKHSPDIIKDLDEFEQQALKQKADFSTAYAPSQKLPLGDSPILVTGITLKAIDQSDSSQVNLSFQLENKMNLGLTISREMLNSIRLLLDELVSGAGWNRNTVEATEQGPSGPVANPATLH